MIRNNKFFIAAVIIGVVAIVGLATILFADNLKEAPTISTANENEDNEAEVLTVPEPTGKVDDIIDSLERELYEETSVIYEEDQDPTLIEGDLTEINGLMNLAEDSEL